MENLGAESTAPTMPSPDTSSPPPPASSPAGRSALPSHRLSSVWLMRMATLAALAAAGAWIIAAVVTASRGLDSSDEGFYLLSYRWWRTDLRTFTGAQFFYGPVFQMLGHNIAGLRLVRLLTIIGANLAFGWTFMRWLRLRRPNAPATRWWEAAGAAVIVACGGMNYSWLPLSPGYNDISLLGALLAAAGVLTMAATLDQGRRIRVWVPLVLGPVAFAMLISKWSSSGLTLLVVAMVGVVVVAPAGLRQVARVAVLAFVGVVLSALAVELVVPLQRALPLIWDTNKLVASGINNPSSLILMYKNTLFSLIRHTALAHGLLLIAAATAVALRNRAGARVAALVAVTTASLSIWILVSVGGFTGGSANIPTYSVGLTLVVALSLIVALGTLLDRRRPFSKSSSLRREGWRGSAIVLMVLALPITQAAGTGNPIFFMAFNCFSAWVALIILVLTGIEGAPRVARALTTATVAAAVLLSSAISTTALALHPYRAGQPSLSTSVAVGVPALRSVTLPPRTAAMYSGLHHVLEPYLKPGGGTYMMAFDGLPGIIFALDGRPVGEAWHSGTGRERTAVGIRAECPNGKGPWGRRMPILLFSRSISGTERDTLKACGLNFSRDYRQVVNLLDTAGFTVYVGTTSHAAPGKGTQ